MLTFHFKIGKTSRLWNQSEGLYMYRILFLLLLIPSFGISQEPIELSQMQSLADFDGEPSAFVNNCVNAISGNITETVPSFSMPGIQPLDFNLSYTSDWSDLQGVDHILWNYVNFARFHYDYINQEYSRDCDGHFTDEYGSRIGLKNSEDFSRIVLDPKSVECGATNSSTGIISGRTNIMNVVVSRGKDSLWARNGAGVIYDFYPKEREKDPTLKQVLYRQTGLNTKIYSTNDDKLGIFKSNRKNFDRHDVMLSEISFNRNYKNRTHHFITNDNHEIEIRENKIDKKNCAVDVISNYAPKVHYHFSIKSKKDKFYLVRKELPNQRTLEISYYRKGKNEWGNQIIKEKSHYPINRVCQLKEPVGTDATLIPTYRFKYEVNDRSGGGEYCRRYGNCKTTTTVFDALGHKTVYEINKQQRLTNIKKFRGVEENTQLYSQEILEWISIKGAPMYLYSRSLVDENNNAQLIRMFKYDQFGNVTSNTIIGNLTGKSTLSAQSNRFTCPHEQISTDYTYTTYNRMSSEDDGRRQIKYTYHDSGDFLKSKFTVIQNHIVLRNFYEYDAGGALILEVNDDGSGDSIDDLTNVTERHITRIENTHKLPAGLPKVVSEYYLDLESNVEVLLSSVVSDYDIQGHLLKAEYFNANLESAYSLIYEYDSFGNLISETNPQGFSTFYKYDENNNKIFEQGPNPLYHMEYGYDFVNRMIREEKITVDGQRFATHHKYDYIGNRIATTDHLGNETKYQFDEFKRLIKTTYPDVLDHTGYQHTPSITLEPNLMGFIAKKIDLDGAITKRTYNIRGDPTKTVYPDGSIELRRYYLTGELHEVIAPNKTTTVHEYDALGRLTTTQIYDANKNLISRSQNTYNNLHLISEQNSEGHITHYHYDGAGRLSKKMLGDSVTTYHYDSLGRMNEERRWIDDIQYIAFIKVFNLMQQVTEERIENEQGFVFTKVAFSYDEEGKILEKLFLNENGLAIESQSYDALGNVVQHVDPAGNITRTIYKYDYVNELGQFVASSEIINPVGVTTLTIHDAMGRIAHVKKLNAFGEKIQEKKLYYDASGRLLNQVDLVIGRESDPVTTCFKYDFMGHLVYLTEAIGTAEEKTMRHEYNKFGQKSADIKPDGVRINYEYDSLGRVVNAQSSDGTIHYSYEYDTLNNVIAIYDKIHDTITNKSYDYSGRLIHEKLANNQAISYLYDKLGREQCVTLPDNSQIRYDYDARMRAVHRYDASGNHLYSHTYDEFDNAGNLLSETFIQNTGQRSFEWNINGQMTSMKTRVWSETDLKYDSLGNLIGKTVQDVPSVYSYDDLDQLIVEKGEYSHQYDYDSLYNRVSKDGTQCQLNSLNQLIEEGNVHYTYDRSGRLEQIDDNGKIKKFSYDAFDRLTTVISDGKITTYIYDAENRRTSKKKGTEDVFHYVYQGQREIGCINSNGNINELRVLGLTKGAELGAAVAIEIKDNVYAPIHDHNGNLTNLIDPVTGGCIETYSYSAFGEGCEDDKISPWRFSSKRFDEETGFYYYGRRYYNPATARWITQDPIGFEGGPNLYAFILNNPLVHSDFYGLETSDGFENISWETPKESTGFFGRVREFVGDVICFVANNCLPIPYVRQGLAYVGHRIAGRSHEFAMKQITPTPSQNRQFKGGGKSVVMDKVTLSAVNGIKTSIWEAGHFFAQISNAFGGMVVDATYNSEHGFISDILECLAHHFGIPTHAEEMLLKNIRTSIARMGGIHGGGVIYLHAHSQGGLITYRVLRMLTAEERAMIDVTTYGSAKMISGMGLMGSRNYINSDLVPFISDPIGVLKGIFCKDSNVHFIRREKSFPGCAHAVLSNYYGAIRNEGDKFKYRYGLQ